MSFDLIFPQSIDEAVSAKENGARWFAGGTDLIPEMKLGFVEPTRLVNLKRVAELRGIHTTNEGVRIGALTTLAEIAEHETIRRCYRAVAQACDLSASPQIRNVASIGGNLNQDSRCAYYRNYFPCYLRGGDKCFLREGENREGAVIAYRDCVHVHPSDPAAALVAFDAQIVARSREGERTIAAQEFFRAPDARDTRMNVLNADEMITEIILPRVSENTRSVYVKAMDRAAWTFALVSVAVKVEVGDSRLETARVVFGGVAPIPYCEFRVEEMLLGKEWNEELVTQGDFVILENAAPLAHNGYKIRLARGMLRRALRECLENT
jgi:xanthine dehydrogenase YagS FAD-binding subunit